MAKARGGIINLPCEITEDEHAELKAKAALCKMHLKDYVRAAVFGYACKIDQTSNRLQREKSKQS